jgi:uncharacterized protein
MQSKEQAFLFDACRRGDVADVSKMCELFPELINESDPRGFTPLIISAYSNQPEIVKILLQHGADISIADAAGNTALMGGAFKGYIDIVKTLLQHGADVNQQNGQQATALTFAATFGQIEIATLLLEKGAVINVPDNRGKTPLDHAVIQENKAMIELLSKISSS